MDKEILKQSVGNIYWKDLEGRYLGCNETFAKICGLNSSKDIIGKKDVDLINNPSHVRNILKIDQYVIKTGNKKTLEEISLDQEGNVVIYLTEKAPLRDPLQNIIGVIGTSINITDYFDLKDYIIRHTTGNVYWKNRQGHYLGCNDSYAEMIGLSHPNEIIGKSDRELFENILDEESLKAILELDQIVLKEGIEKTVEEVGINKYGGLAFYMTKKVPMRDEENNIIGLVGNSLDVSKQKQAEISKLEFLRNMSHDIMTPFTGIQGISSILFEEETDPDKKAHLKFLIQSSDRLLQLFKQILEVAEFGDRTLKLEPFDIKTLITETVEMVSVSAKHKGLDINVYCEHTTIVSDKLRVTRILLNLLVNAIKFTDEGFVDITVEFEPSLKIKVKDSGVGIPRDKIDVIFEKFQKLTGSGKHRNFTGSGIGLYIAKQFALELGGDISVESELGVGSTFTFHFNQS